MSVNFIGAVYSLDGVLHVQSFLNPRVWQQRIVELRGNDIAWYETADKRRLNPLGTRVVRLEPRTAACRCNPDAQSPLHAPPDPSTVCFEFLTEARDPDLEREPLRFAAPEPLAARWLAAFDRAHKELELSLTLHLPLERCRFLTDAAQITAVEEPPLVSAVELTIDTVRVPPAFTIAPHGTFVAKDLDTAHATVWMPRRAFIFYWVRKEARTKPVFVDLRFSETEWPRAYGAINAMFGRAGGNLRIDRDSVSAMTFWERLLFEAKEVNPDGHF